MNVFMGVNVDKLTNVCSLRAFAVTGGRNDARESNALGPERATASTSVCAPEMIANPPPSE